MRKHGGESRVEPIRQPGALERKAKTMALKQERHELEQAADLLVAPLYSLEAQRIPRHKLTEGELPRTATGKVLKREIRTRYF